MKELISNLFLRFAFETGILDTVNENIVFLGYTLAIIAILTCFFGFYVYRAEFSILVFIGITLLCCFLMKDKTDWGAITTTFAVIGTAMAFFTYRWHRSGSFIVMGLMAGTITWAYLGENLILSIVIGVLVGVILLGFPVITIAVTTALWGSLLMCEFRTYITAIELPAWIFVLCFIIGVALQMWLTRHQKLFNKIYPSRVTYWMEQRRRNG